MTKRSDKRNETYNCPKCDRIITRKDHLKDHLKSHDNFRFVCLVCNIRYSFLKYLTEHQSKTGHKEYHVLNKANLNSSVEMTSVPVSKPSITTNPKQSFKCSKCNYYANNYGNLKRHLISHQYYFHKCRATDCKMSFRTLKLLKDHQTETGHYDENLTETAKIDSPVLKSNDLVTKSELKSGAESKITSDKNPQQHKSDAENDTNSSNSINIDKSTETRTGIQNFRLLIQQIEDKALKDPKKKETEKIEHNDSDSSSSSKSSYFSAFDSENDDKNLLSRSQQSSKIKTEQLKDERRRAENLRKMKKYRAEQKASNELIRVRKFRGHLNFQCKKCEKSFGKMGSARKHVAGHIYSNLECPKCKRTLPNKTFLTMHLRAHNRLKFICSIGSCQMKFASINCIKKHHVKEHGVAPSEGSDTESETDDDKLRIMTRSMSQMSDLNKHRGKTSPSLPDTSPASSPSPSSSRSNSSVDTTNSSTNHSIPSSIIKQLSALSLAKSRQENSDTSTISTSVKVVDIENVPKKSGTAKNCVTDDKGLKLECLVCSKKFKDSFMLWGHLLNKH